MCKSLLSVIVPVYNVEEYLPSCLDSILQQSFQNIEVLLIDDGSSDESGTICDRYVSEDSRVKAFHIPNAGVSNARNFGLQQAKGEWITFVDSDDLIPQYSFENSISAAVSDNLDVVMTQMRFNQNPDGTKFVVPKMVFSVFRREDDVEFTRKAISNFKLSFLGKIYRRSVLENIRFPEGIPNYEDYVTLWQVAMKCSSYSIINHIGYVARYRLGSASRAHNGLVTYRKRVTSLIYVCDKIMELFSNAHAIRKDLSKFVIIEGLACKNLYVGFAKEDTDEVLTLTSKLWESMQKCCDISWYMRCLLWMRITLIKFNVNGYPIWQYVPIRMALKLM